MEIAPPPWDMEKNKDITVKYFEVCLALKDYGYGIVKQPTIEDIDKMVSYYGEIITNMGNT